MVLAFVYYQCPMLCTQVMNGISSALKVLPFARGQDFDVVLVSFDPARHAGHRRREEAGAPASTGRAKRQAAAWHFLTGDEADDPPRDARRPASPTSGTSAPDSSRT